jgi:nickel-dependent lactate racemase
MYSAVNREGITEAQMIEVVEKTLRNIKSNKVLIVPPDYTRKGSNTGILTNFTYNYLKNQNFQVDIMPAIGTHKVISKEEANDMFGDIPYANLLYHNWRNDCINIGTIPANYINNISNGLMNVDITVQVNKIIYDDYDYIIVLGQVLPHEIAGMSSHSKNILVGLGGTDFINKTHILGALCGIQKYIGKDHSPVRQVFDYAMDKYFKDIKIIYIQTVTKTLNNKTNTYGVFAGEERNTFEDAVRLSQEINVNYVEKSINKCIVYMEPKMFTSTWVANKAIYRTAAAMKDGGELIIMAPGVRTFGEDKIFDSLIREYGYRGKEYILEALENNINLKENKAIVAHLILGPTEGRFKITYAVRDISLNEIKTVGYYAADFDIIYKLYSINKLYDGWNLLDDGEEIYYISHPSSGVWMLKDN